MSDHNRRASDSQKDDIADLIKLENDPQRRAFLIILQNINLSLIANTKTVNDVDTQLKEHLIEFRAKNETSDALLNKGRGMWRVISVMLGLIQCVVGWAVLEGFQEFKSLNKVDVELEKRILITEEQQKYLMNKYLGGK